MMRRALATLLLATAVSDAKATTDVAAPEVDIIAHDYTFAAPSDLPAGRTIFRFTNKGKVIHELSVALLKDGTSAKQVADMVNAKQPLKTVIDEGVGILIAKAGGRSSSGLSTALREGRNYLVICRLQDSASAPLHSRMGMFTVIHVSAARRPSPSPVRVDTIVGSDYAFRAARTLAPGRHTFAFVDAGTVVHEVNIALLRTGVTPEQLFEVAKMDGDLTTLVDEWVGVLFARPGTPPSGALRATLLPHRQYVLMCQLANDDKPPSHLAMGMFGRIQTTGAKP